MQDALPLTISPSLMRCWDSQTTVVWAGLPNSQRFVCL